MPDDLFEYKQAVANIAAILIALLLAVMAFTKVAFLLQQERIEFLLYQ